MKKIVYFTVFLTYVLLIHNTYAQEVKKEKTKKEIKREIKEEKRKADKKLNSKSSDECNENLANAQIAFDEGKVSQAETLLEPCMENFDREEKLIAYRLLVIAYLYTNNDEKAELNMRNLLLINPEYRLKPNDPAEFIEMYKSFRTRPVWVFGAKIGANLTRVNAYNFYSTDNLNVQTMSYTSLLGFNIGGTAIKPITNKIEVLAEINFVRQSYKFSTEQFDYETLVFTENILWGNLPILFKYNFIDKYDFNKTGIKPYMTIGASASYMFASSGTSVRSDVVTKEISRSVTGAATDLLPYRNRLGANAILGFGAEYKMGRGNIVVDARYMYGFLNVSDPKKRYENQKDIFKYGYVDNDFRLGTIMFSVGYYTPIYNPKRRIVKINKRGEQVN